MIRIEISLSPEGWDEEKQEFVEPTVQVLELEHSLASISKWESEWNKPFYSKQEKTYEETLDYIRCMTITPNVDPNVYAHLTNNNIRKINKYIESPMTATTFSNDKSAKNSRETITSELIYYWMTVLNIPFECENWHFNRLITLIKVCNIKSTPPKKRSKKDIMRDNAALNAARRQQLNTKG